MKTLVDLLLTPEQTKLACSLINTFGQGCHPYADEMSIQLFACSYLKKIISYKSFQKILVLQPKERIDAVEELKELL